jgi:hypothetical protein
VQVLTLTSRFARDASVPSFAQSAGFELLEAPFAEALEVISGAPGDARLATQLSLPNHTRPVLVHWEVARDARFREVERYGLFFAHAAASYRVHVALCGLEPGRGYWVRMWAGGSWSPSTRLQTESHASERGDRARRGAKVGAGSVVLASSHSSPSPSPSTTTSTTATTTTSAATSRRRGTGVGLRTWASWA